MSTGEAVPAALAAFVRGNERRAWLFLWLQGGRAEAAGQALAAAIRAFQAQAGRLPMAQWPARFWRLLAASPLEGGGGQWPSALEALAPLAPAPRRALLLRLAAGLDEAPAAEALGLELEAYRAQLALACPRDAAGEVDAQAWYALAQAVQQAGRELPPRRLLWIADLREAALAGRGLAVPVSRAAAPVPEDAVARPRRRWPWVVLVLLACAAALAATVWLRPALPESSGPAPGGEAQADDLRVHDPGPILVESLPDDAPAATAAADLPPAMEEIAVEPLVERFDLLAWHLAGAPDSSIDREARAEDPASPPAPSASSAMPASADGGPAHIAAWQALPAYEQAQLRAADRAFAALPPAERQALQARFAALDGMERRGWWLGPALGADWPALQPLLGYVDEDERGAVLAALRALPAGSRAQLGELGRRTPADARAALRRDLLAQPADRRAAWIEQRSRR
ncbi:hypothetical protein [Pseudoxanthomonas sp.]|uniref:hypothetical protein n=1 Tax=Pseudoxanthomonas sp. TaxID=1871049 RepID=UPI00258CEBA9|nr:hypothetical protein [Pseudoxanthomonas sp.]MCR6687766.1 hypothetical protein [Pseudoxanthomonas sp.]